MKGITAEVLSSKPLIFGFILANLFLIPASLRVEFDVGILLGFVKNDVIFHGFFRFSEKSVDREYSHFLRLY